MSDPAAVSAAGKCPICKRPSAIDYRPFCSKRCADLDLGRWLNGTYRITQNEPDSRIEVVDEPGPPEDESFR